MPLGLGVAFAFGKASVFKYIGNDYPDNIGTVSGIVGLAGGLAMTYGVLFLGYELSIQEWIGLALAIVGIVMVTLGETHAEPVDATPAKELPCTR